MKYLILRRFNKPFLFIVYFFLKIFKDKAVWSAAKSSVVLFYQFYFLHVHFIADVFFSKLPWSSVKNIRDFVTLCIMDKKVCASWDRCEMCAKLRRSSITKVPLLALLTTLKCQLSVDGKQCHGNNTNNCDKNNLRQHTHTRYIKCKV